MDGERNFDWGRLNLYFPEFDSCDGKKGFFWEAFKENPELKHGAFIFLIGDYGVDLVVPTIPEWIQEFQLEGLDEKYHALAGSVYERAREELVRLIPIFNSWRPHVSKLTSGGVETRHLNGHLEFSRGSDGVHCWDYWRGEVGQERESPTDKILSLGEIPEVVLDERARVLRGLKRVVQRSEGDYNSIIGKNLTECVINMDRIYFVAGELAELDFSH